MDVEFSAEAAASRIAAAIGEPARARILYCLLDGHARTSTELALVAEVAPSTASVHLTHLKDRGLVRVLAQGKHRYYSLDGAHTAAALEALMVVAVGPDNQFVSNTPQRLRTARTCYDHMAGTIAVALHDRFAQLGWLITAPAVVIENANAKHPSDRAKTDPLAYDVTPAGTRAFAAFGIDIEATRALRRRFAYGCVDWSERKPHIAGAFGAALLKAALVRKWVSQDLDSRALQITRDGHRELQRHFGVRL